MQRLNVNAISAPAALHYREEVTSTNDLAAKAGREGAVHLTAFTAEIQTKGRGRHQRAWRTFPYNSIALSVVVHSAPDTLPLVACLSIQKAIENVTGVACAIKWPNDIKADGKKMVGILAESYPLNTGGRFHVLGIGANLNTPEDENPADFDAITLQQLCNCRVNREQLLSRFLWQLHDDLRTLKTNGFDAFVDEYRSKCETFGQQVVWKEGTKEITGIARDITPQGGLTLETTAGMVTCMAGEMIPHKQ